MPYNVVSLRGKRILILGGLGFIGSNLAHECLESGLKVTIYDNLDSNSGGNLHNIEKIKDNIHLIIGDIINYDHLIQHVMKQDIIINCAASTSHQYSMREPWENMDVNIRGVLNILEAIRLVNKEVKFIHVGTTTQLGKLQYQPADENHPEFPTDIYSANKMVSEKYVLIYANAYNLRAIVVRFSNVFGPRAAIHSSEFTFNNYFIGLALQDKAITVYNPGKQLRNTIYVDDAVRALLLAAQSDQADKETFFAVSDEHHSVCEIAEETVKAIGAGSVKYIEWPKSRKATEIGDAVFTNKKIKGIFEWSPKINLKNGLILTKEFYSNCIEHYLL